MITRKILMSLRLFAALATSTLFVAWITHPTCACGPKRSPLERALEKLRAAAPATTAAAQHKTRLLFVTESKGFHPGVLPQAEEIMKQLGAKNGFDVTITQ